MINSFRLSTDHHQQQHTQQRFMPSPSRAALTRPQHPVSNNTSNHHHHHTNYSKPNRASTPRPRPRSQSHAHTRTQTQAQQEQPPPPLPTNNSLYILQPTSLPKPIMIPSSARKDTAVQSNLDSLHQQLFLNQQQPPQQDTSYPARSPELALEDLTNQSPNNNHLFHLNTPNPFSPLADIPFITSPTRSSTPPLSSPSTSSQNFQNHCHHTPPIDNDGVAVEQEEDPPIPLTSPSKPIRSSPFAGKFSHSISTPHLPYLSSDQSSPALPILPLPTPHTKLSAANKAHAQSISSTPPQFIFETPIQIRARNQSATRRPRDSRLTPEALANLPSDGKSLSSSYPSNSLSNNPLSELRRFLNGTFLNPPRTQAASSSGSNHSATHPSFTPPPATVSARPSGFFGARASFSKKRSLSRPEAPPRFDPDSSAIDIPILPSKLSFSSLNARDTASSAPTTTYMQQQQTGLHKKYGKFGKVLGSGAGGTVRLIGGNNSESRGINLKFTPKSSTSSHKYEQVYAVKQFRARKKEEGEKEYLKKVTAEFCIGSALHHPNIIKSVEIISERGNYYQVMEYAEYDLFSIVMTGKMSRKETYCVFKQIVSGVHYLHSIGIAHRDLKLDNCVMSRDRRVKIIDFGAATIFKYPGCKKPLTVRPDGSEEEEDEEEEVMKTTDVVGSDPYLAPEILVRDSQGNRACDPRLVDVWSVGIMFVCMTLRRFPWRIADSTDLCFREFVRKTYPLKIASPLVVSKTSTVSPSVDEVNHQTGLVIEQNKQQLLNNTDDDKPTEIIPPKKVRLTSSSTCPMVWDPIELDKEEEELSEKDTIFRLLPKESRLTISRMLRVSVDQRIRFDQLLFDDHLALPSSSNDNNGDVLLPQSILRNQKIVDFNQTGLGWLNSIHTCVHSSSTSTSSGDADHDHVLVGSINTPAKA
ncbi:hypothetical protein MJO28_004555 [Puccinia striiformis f. sp. tritici]|uniref:Uncharacterized protein n=1 Tax=Puccinia striiformis f. sp. tritici TaxID=168172 RepID=A0ACC0EQU1_9BASI|nr:hypothetical protein MJO28_004555 [Puccinia striiformis f. sp. tritici]